MTTPVVPMTARERAARLLVIRVLKDRIAAEEKALREGAAAEFVVGEVVSGLLKPSDKTTALGFVQLTKGRETVTVADQAAFLEWAQRVAPGEVVTVRQVRPSFAAAVLADCKSHGGWISPDGELLCPDGVSFQVGDPILTVKPNEHADQLVAEAFAGNRLQLPGGAS